MTKIKIITYVSVLFCVCLALGQTTAPDPTKQGAFILEDTQKIIRTFDDGSQLIFIQTVTKDTQMKDSLVLLWQAVVKHNGTKDVVWSKTMTGKKEELEGYWNQQYDGGPIFDAMLQNQKVIMLYQDNGNACLSEIDLSSKEPRLSNTIKLFRISWSAIGNIPHRATLLPGRSKLRIWFDMANHQDELWEVVGTGVTCVWRDNSPDEAASRRLPTSSAPSPKM